MTPALVEVGRSIRNVMVSKYIQVSTTVSKKSDGESIARVLSEKHLSACVQIASVTSVYQWKGKLQKSKEWSCVIKTKKNLYKKVEQAIKNLSPYELPEIVANPILGGSKEYLAWMDDECGK